MMAAIPATAGAARIAPVREEGHLHYLSAEATQILDEGAMSGTIPGRARVYFTYNGSPNERPFHYPRRGRHDRRAGALPAAQPHEPDPQLSRRAAITGGSGRYAHAAGNGELFGVFHRHGYALVVQAIGRLRY